MSSTNASAGFANAELFRDLTPQELAPLERVAHKRHYDAGATILREGQGGIAFFVITSGKVSVTRSGSDGQPREIRTIGPGGAFGEMALFSDRPRAATITAVEPTDCLALHRLEFLDELRRHPDVALRLLNSLAIRLDEASALM
ncbi:MAG: cyclic nucleotide-binding domain-containing protein [Chloroflexi bacterium]|nr:cyclic nucleotide-binding domain-containing protein [Chloroflexota bacterium]MBV9132100.1 cyclic nucleotide-binding domain-containing protein [Chloroflexota bacterium]MBV9897757.1 cyclic nucleotide-binding domain-containing protein [Chloroflexota bacterium]